MGLAQQNSDLQEILHRWHYWTARSFLFFVSNLAEKKREHLRCMLALFLCNGGRQKNMNCM